MSETSLLVSPARGGLLTWMGVFAEFMDSSLARIRQKIDCYELFFCWEISNDNQPPFADQPNDTDELTYRGLIILKTELD